MLLIIKLQNTRKCTVANAFSILLRIFKFYFYKFKYYSFTGVMNYSPLSRLPGYAIVPCYARSSPFSSTSLVTRKPIVFFKVNNTIQDKATAHTAYANEPSA